MSQHKTPTSPAPGQPAQGLTLQTPHLQQQPTAAQVEARQQPTAAQVKARQQPTAAQMEARQQPTAAQMEARHQTTAAQGKRSSKLRRRRGSAAANYGCAGEAQQESTAAHVVEPTAVSKNAVDGHSTSTVIYDSVYNSAYGI